MSQTNTPLLHVGYHKTGHHPASGTVVHRRERLLQSWTSGTLRVALPSPQGKGYGASFDFDPGAVREAWAAAMADKPADARAVISNEGLLNHVYNGGNLVPLIAARLHAVFPDARVLITIRDQPNLIRSAYEHFMLGGGLCSIDAFLRPLNEYQIPFFDPEHLHYDRAIAHYQSLFGAENVLVLPHEMLTQEPAAFIGAVMDFAGLPSLSAERVAAITGNRVNTFDPRQAAVVRWLSWVNLLGAPTNQNARAGLGYEKLCRTILWYAAKATPKPTAVRSRAQLLEHIRTAVGDRYSVSNRRVMAMTGLDLVGLGYRVADPASPGPAPGYQRAPEPVSDVEVGL